MSVKLSEIEGAVIPIKISEFEILSEQTASMPQTNYNLKNDMEKLEFRNNIIHCEGFNQCREKQSLVQLTLDRDKVASEVYVYRRGGQAQHFDLEFTEKNDPDMWNECLNIADALNAHLSEILVAGEDV